MRPRVPRRPPCCRAPSAGPVLDDVTTPGACVGAYSRTIRWVATDACGNVSDPVSETWTVLDTSDPTLSGVGPGGTHNTLSELNDPTEFSECPLGRTRLATLVKGGSEAGGSLGAGDARNPTLETPGPMLELYRPTPNPFVHDTRLAYAVPAIAGERVEIGVYDVAGRRIRALVSGHMNPGRHETGWDGRNAEGVRVTNGMYFIHILVGQHRRTVHVVYLR